MNSSNNKSNIFFFFRNKIYHFHEGEPYSDIYLFIISCMYHATILWGVLGRYWERAAGRPLGPFF